MRKYNFTYRKNRYRIKKEDRKILRHMSETLDEVLELMSKPQSRAMVIIDVTAAIMSIFGIISVVETIKNWIGG